MVGDGLRIFPGLIESRTIVAGPWLPDGSLVDYSNDIRPEFLWVALDCTSGPKERALILFRWLGSGAGSWSGFPFYEAVAERLLLAQPTDHLVAALTEASDALTDAHLEGAARYFSGWEFRQGKRDEARLVPHDLRQRLLAHALRSTDPDKVERARAALAQ